MYIDNKNNKGLDVTELDHAVKTIGELRERIAQQIFGQRDLVTETLCCLFAGGHILMTGAPGLAKTTLVRVIAGQLGLGFARIQFTPDLLPTDIVGSEILNIDPGTGRRSFEFSQGPVFTNLLLADEINRASPRTQSALLEAMQERTVTARGHMHPLPLPFMVFATQNPFESEGTFPLPEAQLDRFLIHALVDYPDGETEQQILRKHADNGLAGEKWGAEVEPSDALLDHQAVSELIETAKSLPVDDSILHGINELVRSSRPNDDLCPSDLRDSLWYGAGPRAGISLISVGRVLAVMEGQDTVRWQHVRRLAKPVMRHRMRLSSVAGRSGLNEDVIIERLLKNLESRNANLARGVS